MRVDRDEHPSTELDTDSDPSSQDCEAPEFLVGISLLGKPKGTAGLFTRPSQGWATAVRPFIRGRISRQGPKVKGHMRVPGLLEGSTPVFRDIGL